MLVIPASMSSTAEIQLAAPRGVRPGQLRLRSHLIYGIGFAEGGLFTDAPIWETSLTPCASPLSPRSSKSPVRQRGKGGSLVFQGNFLSPLR